MKRGRASTTRAIAGAVTMTCATAAALGGCLSIPSYAPETAVSYSERGAGGMASGPGFALRFSDEGAFHFPDSLVVGGEELLGRDPGASCAAQNETGMLIYPTPRISPSGEAEPLVNRLTPVLRGPAVVQVTLAWATRLTCNSAREPSGVSTFTVFPDARIVRHDAIQDPRSDSIAASQCACGAVPADGVQFTVSSFWTLSKAPFHTLHAPDPGPLPVPADVTTIANRGAACVEGDARRVGVVWRNNENTAILGTDALLVLDHSMKIGESNLEDYVWEDTTALFLDSGSCDAAFKRAIEHVVPPALTVNGVSVLPGVRDAIYGSEAGGQAPGVALDASRVVLSGTLDHPFAVWLRFPGPVEELRASLEGATGPWYLPQRVDDRSWIVWFRDPISSVQQIVIEPR